MIFNYLVMLDLQIYAIVKTGSSIYFYFYFTFLLLSYNYIINIFSLYIIACKYIQYGKSADKKDAKATKKHANCA